jgi:hypothetical protein
MLDEQLKDILMPICRERAMSFAARADQIELLTLEMVDNLASQIHALYVKAGWKSPEGKK